MTLDVFEEVSESNTFTKNPNNFFYHISLYMINVYHELLCKKFKSLRLCSQLKKISITAAKLKPKLPDSACRKKNGRGNMLHRTTEQPRLEGTLKIL